LSLHLHVCVHVCMCMCACACMYMCVCVCVCMNVWMLCMRVYVYVCACVCVYMCVHVYVVKYIYAMDICSVHYYTAHDQLQLPLLSRKFWQHKMLTNLENCLLIYHNFSHQSIFLAIIRLFQCAWWHAEHPNSPLPRFGRLLELGRGCNFSNKNYRN